MGGIANLVATSSHCNVFYCQIRYLGRCPYSRGSFFPLSIDFSADNTAVQSNLDCSLLTSFRIRTTTMIHRSATLAKDFAIPSGHGTNDRRQRADLRPIRPAARDAERDLR